MKNYAKKRESIVAVQWTGEMTPEVTELIGARIFHVEAMRQLVFANAKGPGRFVSVGDWIVSSSGEDLGVFGDQVFQTLYEEADETGRVLPTDDEHEAAGREFVQELDALLIDGLKLSREEHPKIFRGRDRLWNRVRCLLDDERYKASKREQQRVLEKIATIVKELTP